MEKVSHRRIIRKVKALVAAAAAAALAGAGVYLGDVDWGAYGAFGPALGLVMAAAIAWGVKSLRADVTEVEGA